MNISFIGIDNGVTGSIGILTPDARHFFRTPIKKEQSYTKKKQNISRIDVIELERVLTSVLTGEFAVAMIERPLVNPGMFKSTLSAMRALEATLCVLERMGIGLEYVDSKEWQKALLPQGIKGTPDLKAASTDIGKRMYPAHSDTIDKQKDADGLLIAHYLMTKYNQA